MSTSKVDPDRVIEFIVDNMPAWGYLVALGVALGASCWLAGKAFSTGGRLLGAARSALRGPTRPTT